jgi:hypothetical protein
MLFIVRGKNRNHDRSLRIHANSAEEAEAIGFKRALFVTEVTLVDASNSQIGGKLDRVAELVRRAWQHTPADAFKAFGKAISNGQAAAIVFLGVATWAIDLHALVLH